MVVAACLNLHEYHLIAVHSNDVDVAVARFPVAVDDDIPLLLQVSLGQFLALEIFNANVRKLFNSSFRIHNYIVTLQRINISIMLKTGEKAPEVLGFDENGKEIRLSDFQGKKLVLYFYPKDSTSGCTAEACSLRDNYSALRKQGYAVVGVSVQDAKSHQKFIEKNQLPFPLIADTENRLVQEFGVWGEKSMYGRKYMGTFRTTFIINEEGIIEKVFLPKEIKTKTHAEQILELLA